MVGNDANSLNENTLMAQSNVLIIFLMCAFFLADAQIHLGKRMMTVQLKVTVTILLVQMQFNGPILLIQALFASSLKCVLVVCTLHTCSLQLLLPCVYAADVCACGEMFVCFRRLPLAAGIRRALPGLHGGALRQQSGGDLRGYEAGAGCPSHPQHL